MMGGPGLAGEVGPLSRVPFAVEYTSGLDSWGTAGCDHACPKDSERKKRGAS